MMIYTILFLYIIRTDRLFLLSPDDEPQITSDAIEVLQTRPKYFFGRFVRLFHPRTYFLHHRDLVIIPPIAVVRF